MKKNRKKMTGRAAIIVALAVVVSLAGGATARAGEENPLVGSWTLTVSMGGKEFDVNVVIKPDLTGTATWEWSDEAAALEDVVSDGGEASFTCPDILGLEFYGSIDGDTFAGDISSDYGDGEFEGVRN